MPDSSATRRDSERGLLSVAQIQHVLRVEFARAQRYGYPLTCMLIAVDQLGSVRDSHGYDAKEQVVDAVVALMRSSTRSSDFLGRTGDDRLMAVVPHTSSDGARIMATRLIEGVRARDLARSQDAARITISIGLSVSDRTQTMYFDSLLESAEAAVADAIASGGDRWVARDPLKPKS
jgi:diguanylate cyclase (GGDEF)-like protein